MKLEFDVLKIKFKSKAHPEESFPVLLETFGNKKNEEVLHAQTKSMHFSNIRAPAQD